MSGPVLTATQVSLNYFNLRQEPFDEALADDVKFSVQADLCEPDKGADHFKAELSGKDEVVAFLAARHFGIAREIKLEKLSSKELDGKQVKVKFISIETKNEDAGPVTYRYNGHYTLSFSEGKEGLMVKEIALKNRREVYGS